MCGDVEWRGGWGAGRDGGGGEQRGGRAKLGGGASRVGSEAVAIGEHDWRRRATHTTRWLPIGGKLHGRSEEEEEQGAMASGESAACVGVQHEWRWVELEAEEEEQGTMASGESVACGMAGRT
jgi:hypothetical protein